MSHILRIGIAENPNPSLIPSLTNPGAQNSSVGNAASLQLVASDPNGDTLNYAATGLPPGLAINAVSGLISGTPTTTGTYNVVVSASDGINVASANFLWSVSGTAPLVFESLPVPSPVPSNGSASYTASASGVNVLYKWNFGDGSPETDVVDIGQRDAHLHARRDVLGHRHRHRRQRHAAEPQLPAAGASAADGRRTCRVDQPARRHATGWRQPAAVGRQPGQRFGQRVRRRHAHEAGRDRSRRGAAIDRRRGQWHGLGDEQSRRVDQRHRPGDTRRDANDRAAARVDAVRHRDGAGQRPSPSWCSKATGQLLKFDAASYAQLGVAAVGPNPRHLSVSADGAHVYVSRFITPPLPGEATATVSPTAATGGEVVVVDAATMAIARTVVLRHSDRPDFENQGRGVPNYLGAATISPDGTQAWVPSKQDNVQRGALRDGTGLNFQNTVRAISSRIVLASGSRRP